MDRNPYVSLYGQWELIFVGPATLSQYIEVSAEMSLAEPGDFCE